VGILYTAEHPALALVEILVHMPQVPYRELPAYRQFTLQIPKQSQRIVDVGQLPAYWHANSYVKTQAILRDWLLQPDVLALGVPSSVLPDSINYLFHPGHPDFASVTVVDEKPLVIDPRL
jgi:RES domain-containing protein